MLKVDPASCFRVCFVKTKHPARKWNDFPYLPVGCTASRSELWIKHKIFSCVSEHMNCSLPGNWKSFLFFKLLNFFLNYPLVHCSIVSWSLQHFLRDGKSYTITAPNLVLSVKHFEWPHTHWEISGQIVAWRSFLSISRWFAHENLLMKSSFWCMKIIIWANPNKIN